MSTELEKLKQELEYRQTTKRKEIAIELRRAEELGDLFRENFPYDAAVADQRHNETRIINLENAIKSLSEKRLSSKKIQIGCSIELEKEDGARLQVRLVDEDVFRARIYSNAITTESILGKYLLNKKEGSEFLVAETQKKYKVINIEY